MTPSSYLVDDDAAGIDVGPALGRARAPRERERAHDVRHARRPTKTCSVRRVRGWTSCSASCCPGSSWDPAPCRLGIAEGAVQAPASRM